MSDFPSPVRWSCDRWCPKGYNAWCPTRCAMWHAACVWICEAAGLSQYPRYTRGKHGHVVKSITVVTECQYLVFMTIECLVVTVTTATLCVKYCGTLDCEYYWDSTVWPRGVTNSSPDSYTTMFCVYNMDSKHSPWWVSLLARSQCICFVCHLLVHVVVCVCVFVWYHLLFWPPPWKFSVTKDGLVC